MISQKSNRVAAIKNRFENLNDTSEGDLLINNSRAYNNANRTTSPIKRQLIKQSSVPIVSTLMNIASSSTNHNSNVTRRQFRHNNTFHQKENRDCILQDEEQVLGDSYIKINPEDFSDTSCSGENSENVIPFYQSLTDNTSLMYNEIDDGRSSLRPLSRQTSDPGKKLQRSHAFRCDRSQKVPSSPKRHSSCNGRSQSNISNAPTLRIGEKPRLSREKLKKLSLVLEEKMKRDNFSDFSKNNRLEMDKENVGESSFVHSNREPSVNTSSFLHPHGNTSCVVLPDENKSFLHSNENTTSFLHPHVQCNENTPSIIHPHMNTNFLHSCENSTSFIHLNNDTSCIIMHNNESFPCNTSSNNIQLPGFPLVNDNEIPQHILDQYSKVIKPKKSNLICHENTTEMISKHLDTMTDSGVSSETENVSQDNDINDGSTANENLRRKTKLMKIRAQFEELADSTKDNTKKLLKYPQNVKYSSEFRTKHISVPENDTGLLMAPNLYDSKDGLNSSSETIKKLAVKNPHIVLTDTLKKALKQPLPDGPPPKKPPRIFAANSTENENDLNEMSPIQESIEMIIATPKNSKQDSKSMLEKIEKALIKHNDLSKTISPRSRVVMEDTINPEICEKDEVETRKKNRKEIHYMCTEILDLPYNKETEITPNKLTDVLNMSKCFPSLNCTVATNRSSGSFAYARLSSGSCASSNRNSLSNVCCSCSGDSAETLHEHSIEIENRSKFSTFFNITTSQNEILCRKCGNNMGKVDDEFRCHLGCKCEELKNKKDNSSKFYLNESKDKGKKLGTECEHIYAEPFQYSEANEVGSAKEKLVRGGLKSIQKVGVGLNDGITLRGKEPLPMSSAGENKVKDLLKRWESTGVNESSFSDCESNVVCDGGKIGGCDKECGVSWDKEYGQINEDEKIYDLPCADSERSTSPESIEIRSTSISSPRSGPRTIDSIRRDFETRALSPTEAKRASSSSPQNTIIRSGNSSFADIRKSLETKLGETTPPSTVVSQKRFEKRISSESAEETKNRRRSNQQRRYGSRTQLDIDRENLNCLMNEIYETVSVACEMEQGSTSSSSRSDSGSRTNKFPVDGADNSSEDSIKLSRSLTEKRKNYVRRVSSRAAFQETTTVGRVKVKVRHQTSVGGAHDPGYDGNQAPGSYATFRSWKSFKMLGSQKNLNDLLGSESSEILDLGTQSTSAQENLMDEIKCLETRGKLFDVCLLVGMNHMTGQAYVKSIFPEGITPPPQIENLVFPETLTSEQQSTKMNVHSRAEYDLSADSTQTYSLVLTNERGERSFGYCRRVLPEGAGFCLPLAYCMISRYRAPGFYYKILQEIESNHGGCDSIQTSILKQLYKSELPEAGSSISVNRHIKSTPPRFLGDLKKNSMYRNSVNLGDVLNKCRTLPSGQGNVSRFTKDDSFKSKEKTECSEFKIDGPDRRKSIELVSEYFDVENNNNTNGDNFKFSLPQGAIGDMDSHGVPKHVLEQKSIKRPIEPRVDENSLSILLDSMSAGLLMEVFGTLLLERKVVLISQHLSQLSSCMEALQQILYPFVWQHTLISTIPADLKRDILEAPIPILAGLLSTRATHYPLKSSEAQEKDDSWQEELKTVHFEEGMLIDLSPENGDATPRVIFRQGDETSILPSVAYKTLKTSLNLDQNSKEKVSKKREQTQDMEQTRNILISEAFLRFFVDSLGEFSNYFDVKKDLEKDDTGNVVFEKEKFIKSAPSKHTQCFLEWFTETAMFTHFIRNMTVGRPHHSKENPKTSSENVENEEKYNSNETNMVDLPYKDFYRTFEERIVNSKARNGAKGGFCKKTAKMGGDVASCGKSNYKNIVNKKVKSLRNKLKDLVN